MNALGKWVKSFFKVSSHYAGDDWPSVVLLLRQPDFPKPEALFDLAQKAWGTGGQVKVVGTLREKNSYIFACQTVHGPLWFSIHKVGQRYGVEGQESLEVLQKPWDKHQAWMAIDSPHQRNVDLIKKKALGDIYKLLLIYAFLVWSPNVLAVFFPAERTTIPNFGDLAASIQWGRRNGLELTFLDD
jgi:hypothetical protein